jgi:voltage-gated potassium channel Kch
LWWRRYWWIAITATGLLALALAAWGSEGNIFSRLNVAVHLLPIGIAGAPPPPEHPSLQLQIARLLAPIAFAYATFRAVFALFAERLQDVSAQFKRDHLVVCGLGDQGEALVENLLHDGHKVVALEVSGLNPAVRRLRDEGATVLVGDATDPDSMRRAQVVRARHVVSVCGQDAMNAQVAANALDLVDRPPGKPLSAFIQITDPRLYTFLLLHALGRSGARLEFFNLYERAVRSMLDDAEVDDGVHDVVLVAGAGELGTALVSNLARRRYERTLREEGRQKLHVHIVDREAEARVHLLYDRYARLSDVCDLTPHEMDVQSPAFDHLVEQGVGLAGVDIAFVCFDDDALTVGAALNLLDQTAGRMPVVARVTHRSRGIARLIDETKSHYAQAAVFRPLSLVERACRADLVLEGVRGQLAREVHEAYRSDHPGTIYDVPWKDLTEEGRERNFRHADEIAQQLEAAGYRLGPQIDWGQPLVRLDSDEIESMARMEHQRWRRERQSEGWRLGPRRDDVARMHPDILDWDALPDEQRDINRRLVERRPAMLARVGIELSRG